MLHNYYSIHKHCARGKTSSKTNFSWSCSPPSRPLSNCSGMATSGKPSTKFPLGELEQQEPLPLSVSISWNAQKYYYFSTFLKSLDPVELWNFEVIFKLWYHFYKLQYVLHNYYWIHKHLYHSRNLKKLRFHGQEYLRAAAPSGPLSYCFGITQSRR